MSKQKTYTAEEINAELALASDFNSSDIFQRKRNRSALIGIIVQLRRENAQASRRWDIACDFLDRETLKAVIKKANAEDML